MLHSRGRDGIGSNTIIVTVTPWWQTALNVTQIALAVLSVVAVVLLVADMVPSKKKTSNQSDRSGHPSPAEADDVRRRIPDSAADLA